MCAGAACIPFLPCPSVADNITQCDARPCAFQEDCDLFHPAFPAKSRLRSASDGPDRGNSQRDVWMSGVALRHDRQMDSIRQSLAGSERSVGFTRQGGSKQCVSTLETLIDVADASKIICSEWYERRGYQACKTSSRQHSIRH